MQSENNAKKMKDEVSGTATAAAGTQGSILPQIVQEILRNGKEKGFARDVFELSGRDITDEMIPELCEWIKNNGKNIRELDLSLNGISPEGISRLFILLKEINPNIHRYVLYQTEVNDDCIKDICAFIDSNQSVEDIIIGETEVTDEGLAVLLQHAMKSKSMKTIDVCCCMSITDKSIPNIIECIEKSDIIDINVGSTRIKQKNVVPLQLLLKKIKKGLKDIMIVAKKLNDEDIQKICEVLKKYNHSELNTLNLSLNEFSSTAFFQLIQTLKDCKIKLKRFDMYGNRMGDDYINALGDYIQFSSSLNYLDISNTMISDAGVLALSKYLAGDKTLRQLRMNMNQLSDKSTQILIDIINKSTLESVLIADTGISDISMVVPSLAKNVLTNGSSAFEFSQFEIKSEVVKEICMLMKQHGCDKLKVINLSYNQIPTEAAVELFHTLMETNTTITHINLERNCLDDNIIKPFGGYLEKNQSLEYLNFGNNIIQTNNISDKGVEQLSELLIGNTSVTSIDLALCKEITDASVPHLMEIARRSHAIHIRVLSTSISQNNLDKLAKALKIPVNQREIPISSTSKSAAKRV